MPTTTPAGEQLLDTRIMPTLHTFFRRETRLAGGLLRGVGAGDVRRARVVSEHLSFVARHLHHHHTVEDRLLWPVLLERVPDELAPLVHLMESQHEAVDALLQEVTGLLPSFADSADPALGARLADLMDALHTALDEHLTAEETRLLPLAARTLSQQEWDAMGEAGRGGTPRKELSLSFGMYQYEGEPAALAMMLAEAPAPVRFLVPRLSRRAFRRHARRVHGTPTP
jgi:hemerythrin-like domain-containing protein